MKRLTHILCVMIYTTIISSCGVSGHMAPGYNADEIRSLILFEPVSKIETIGKGEIRITDDTASMASQEILLQAFKTQDTGLEINSVYTPSETKQQENIRKDIEFLYAQHLNSGRDHDGLSLAVPEYLDQIIEKTGNRYGMAVYCYGFSRTGGNYATQIAKSFGLALLSLGSVYTIPYKDKSNLHVFIIDSEENRMAWSNVCIGPDYNPLKPKHIEKQLKLLFKQFRK